MTDGSGRKAGASDELAHTERIPVAQYVRMSTEHQRYSTDNQIEAIAEYADRHGMVIIRTYADAGKSGLNLRGRAGLQQLLADVQQPNPGFSAVVVYDVSRWGRFPDPDEAAVYEQSCKRRGVKVIYCAEPFKNDGSLSSTVMIGLKRSMAAEYSRELSVKVFAGHRNLVQRGYRQGGAPGFGLRRQLVDEQHNIKGSLSRGEKKSIQTDRVLLVPGPDEEIATIHLIYRLFLQDSKPERVIAAELNRMGMQTDLNRPWTRGTVHQILTNEKYIGNNVYNRTSFKLKIEHTKNSPSDWIRKEAAFSAIVPETLFRQAQAIIEQRARHLDDEQMLGLLSQIHKANGRVSGVLIDEAEGVPSSSSYRTRFGSLQRAYELIGYRPRRDYAYLEINRALRRYHPEVVEQFKQGVEAAGAVIRTCPDTDLILINEEFTVSIVVSRCKTTSTGTYRWLIRLDTSLTPDVTIVTRMDHANRLAHDFYVLPSLDFARTELPRGERNGISLDFYRVEALDAFYALCARTQLAEAA
ncbi:MAG TPA: recombinase family protein [Burkholderiaceae bacterium]|jgi:DNA invertase Pin-like site-specific DNA recombinase